MHHPAPEERAGKILRAGPAGRYFTLISMNSEELRARLQGLHHELSRQPDLDERGRQTLAEVRGDLERLDASSSQGGSLSPEDRSQMQDRWQNAIVSFETSHPQIASGLEQMAVILSNFGL